MRATELLRKQHRELETLLKEVLHGATVRERRALLHEIAARIEVHARIEEEIFYPALRAEAGGRKIELMVLEAYEEHHVVDLVLRDLARAELAAPSFEAKLTVFKELLEHHIEEEEHEMFPMAERKLGARRLTELGLRMLEKAEACGAGGL
jgi:hemerythrin-like domain-containing protein